MGGNRTSAGKPSGGEIRDGDSSNPDGNDWRHHQTAIQQVRGGAKAKQENCPDNCQRRCEEGYEANMAQADFTNAPEHEPEDRRCQK